MSKTIFEFYKGQKIKRVESAKPYPSGIRDRSYIGEPMLFLGIKGNQIHLKRERDGYIHKLDIEIWLDGWVKIEEKEEKEMILIPQEIAVGMVSEADEILDQIKALEKCWEGNKLVSDIYHSQHMIFKQIKSKYLL